MINLISVLLVLIGTVIGSFGAIYLKKGSKKISINNLNLIFGLFLYGISLIMYIIALKGEKLSVLYPIVSLSYVWVGLLSIKMLNEKMNPWKWAGIAIIVLGVSLIGIGS